MVGFSKFAIINIKALLVALVVLFVSFPPVFAGEELYRELSRVARGLEDVSQFDKLIRGSRQLNWNEASETEFVGHLRLLEAEAVFENDLETSIYLVRNITGELHILSVPPEYEIQQAGEDSPYYNLADRMGMKLSLVLC